jgi:hypothetical protein
MFPRVLLFGAGAAAALGLALLAPAHSAQNAAPPDERKPFQQVLLVPPNDKDYIVVKIPAGSRAVVTDVIAYNALDGKGHRVGPNAESYVWVGGYVDGKSVGLVNRMRILGNETEQWHLAGGMELGGAPELVVSSEKGTPGETPVLVHLCGYLTR